MAELRLRIKELIEEREDDLDFSKETYGADLSNFPEDGNGLKIVYDELRFLGIAHYAKDGDPEIFNSYLSKAVSLSLHLMRIPIKLNCYEQYFVLRRYQEILTALSVGYFDEAIEMSRILGYRPEIEKEFDDDFSQAIGYTLKKILHNDAKWQESRLADIRKAAQDRKTTGLGGISDIFKGIIYKDQEAIDKGFDEFLKEYKKQCKPKGIFHGVEDELLCIWGVGLANLVLYKGLKVNIDDEMMPRELFF